MSASLYCRNCGQRLEVPAGYTRAKLRCECGVFNDVPAAAVAKSSSSDKQPAPEPSLSELFDSEPENAAAPSTAIQDKSSLTPAPSLPRTPAPAAPESASAPERKILLHGTDEDDFNPYPVHGDAPTRKCPECGTTMDLRAKLCVRCGFGLESGQKAERTFEIIDQTWENGWPLKKRRRLFAVLQAINVLILLWGLLTSGAVIAALVFVLLTAGLQAFILGTYDRLRLTRNSKGKVMLTRTWRYAFLDRPAQTLRWKEHVAIGIITLHETYMSDWVVFVILLVYGIVPGILFWRYAILPPKFDIVLCKEHGAAETVICRTTNQERVHVIVQRISEVTTLAVR